MISGLLLQQVPIGHRDAAKERSDDTDVALVRATNEYIWNVSCTIYLLVWGTINRTIVVPSKPLNGLGREKIGINDMTAKVGNELDGGLDSMFTPAEFFQRVFFVG